MRSLFILLILSFGMQTSFAAKVKLYGHYAAYANTQIKVFYYNDAFSKMEKQLGIMKVDKKGQFSMEFDIEKTQKVFLSLGVFRAYLFVEEEKSYQLNLPPRRDLSPAQKIDPFFEAQDLMLGLRNADKKGLNNLIRKFDFQFDNFVNQNFDEIYNQGSASFGKSFIEQMQKEYADVSQPYFKVYLEYSLGLIDYLSRPEAYISLENKYFANKPLELNNPAYATLFDKIYDNSLGSAFNRREKSKFSKALASPKPYENLTKAMVEYPIYQDENFKNISLSKAIFDGTIHAILTRRKAIHILQQVEQNSQDLRVDLLCKNYIKKLYHLLKGARAPKFKVGNVKLADYKGKYLYLNFCNTTNAVWKRDIQLLNKLHKAFGKEVAFLSLANDPNLLEEKTKLQKFDVNWPVVQIDENNTVLIDYKIKVFPTYIIIDPEGKVYQYPARGPHDGVENIFVKIQRETIRKNYTQNK